MCSLRSGPLTAICGSLVAFLFSCDSGSRTSSEPPASRFDEPAGRTSIDRIKWLHDDGRLVLKLKRKDNGYKLYDADDQSLGKVRVKRDRVTLKGADDRETWKIKRKEHGAEVEDSAGNRLFKIKREDDAWKLRDPADRTLVKFKPKEDGYEARDDQGNTLAKIKARDGKLVFKSETGADLGSLVGVTDSHAGMWLVVPGLSEVERCALLVFFLEIDRPREGF